MHALDIITDFDNQQGGLNNTFQGDSSFLLKGYWDKKKHYGKPMSGSWLTSLCMQ